jgi:hypothetical protein
MDNATTGTGSATVTVPVTSPDLSASEASDGSGIDVSWDFSDTTANNAGGFDLFRETNSGTFTEIQSGISSTTTSYTDTSVSNDDSYTYALIPYAFIGGVKTTGATAQSSADTMVGTITAIPSTDPILVNSGGVATIDLPFTDSNSADGTPTATIDWGDGSTPTDATVSPAAAPAVGYTISGSYPDYADGTYTATVTITTTDTSATPTQVPIEIEVGGIPDAPASASASGTGGDVIVTWTPDSNDINETGFTATGYTVYGSTDSGTTWTALDEVDSTQDSDSLSGLTPGDSYEFQVTATNDFGESAATTAIDQSNDPVAVEAPAVPGAPSELVANLAAGNVTLNWATADSLATGFNIYESIDSGSTFSFFDSVSQDSSGDPAPTTYTATGLTAGTTPQFYVTATNASGESAPSNSAGVAAPAAPGGLAVTLSGNDEWATISWQQTPNAIGYYVTRLTDDGSVAPYTLPEVAPGTTTHVVDTGSDLSGGHLDPTAAYSWTVTAVYPTSLAIGYGSGNGSGSGGGDGGSGGGGSGGDSGGDTDGSDGSSSGTGTGSDSDPADDYTGNIGSFTATVSGTTVSFTWTYQGSATFELEQEDTSDPGTNFAFIQAPGGRTATVTGLNDGDNYKFRIRADRSDGTVSDYVSASASIAATSQSGGGSAFSNPTLPAPAVSNITLSTGPQAGSGGFSLDCALPIDPTDDYPLNVDPDSDQNNPLNVPESGGSPVGEIIWGNYALDPNLAAWALSGTSGDTYTFDVRIGGYDQTNTLVYSPASLPITVKTGGTLPTALSLKLGQTDQYGNPTVTWETPAGVTSGSVSVYRLVGQGTNQTAVLIGSGYPLNNTTGVGLGGLPAGNSSIFAVYQITSASNPNIAGWSPYSNYLQVKVAGGAPTAPAEVSATTVLGADGQEQVDVDWQNTPNDETGFLLQRCTDDNGTGSIGSDLSDGWATIASTGADETAAVDTNVVPGATYSYRIVAASGTAESSPSPTATPAAPQEYICLLQGNNTNDPINNLFHTSIGVGDIVNGKLNVWGTYSFGLTASDPNALQTFQPHSWLGFPVIAPAGTHNVGAIYLTNKYYSSVLATKAVTAKQASDWLKYMHSARSDKLDEYSPIFGCPLYCALEYSYAPSGLPQH